MKHEKDDSPVRLRPRKPPSPREPKLWASTYLLLSRTARLIHILQRRSATRRSLRSAQARSRTYFQRVAVRITYSKNRNAGTWRAHGRYIARESATKQAREAGFDHSNDAINPARRLDEWQRANDERFWKFIVSPEFGDRVDLELLTRELMVRLQRDLGTELEWVAVSHFNTEHRHVHVALRGIRENGQPLLLGRDYVKQSIRHHAEELCTQRLGYRTRLDAEEAQRREVSQPRFTSLDRLIARDHPQDGEPAYFSVCRDAEKGSDRYVIARLRALVSMGLAEQETITNSWRVRSDFERILRSMQRTADRQRTLATHGLPVSDKRLPFHAMDFRQLKTLEGRVLVHGEDEISGRHHLMLEGTDAKIYFVLYSDEMEKARARGQLRPGSFVSLRKQFENGRPALEVNNLGDAEALLQNERHFAETAKRLARRGTVPQENWDGWLGRYQSALRTASGGRQITKATSERER